MSSISHRSKPITSCLLLSNGSAGKFQKRTANAEINGILRISLLLSCDFLQKCVAPQEISYWQHLLEHLQNDNETQGNNIYHYTTLAQICHWGESESVCGFWLVSADKFHKKMLMICAESKVLPSRLKIISSGYLACFIYSVIFRG